MSDPIDDQDRIAKEWEERERDRDAALGALLSDCAADFNIADGAELRAAVEKAECTYWAREGSAAAGDRARREMLTPPGEPEDVRSRRGEIDVLRDLLPRVIELLDVNPRGRSELLGELSRALHNEFGDDPTFDEDVLFGIADNLRRILRVIRPNPSSRPRNDLLRAAVWLMRDYWVSTGKSPSPYWEWQEALAGPHKGKKFPAAASDETKFIKRVFDFIDPTSLNSLPDAMKARPGAKSK